MNYLIRCRAGLLPVLLCGAGVLPLGAETWTDSLGRKFDAEFVKVHGDKVILKKANGGLFSTPLEGLDEASRARVGVGVGVDGNGGSPAAEPLLLPPLAGTPMVVPAEATNLGWPWPGEARVDAGSRSRVISEDREQGKYVYESPSYRFTANARITDDALRNFSIMFECTHKFARALPLGLGGGRGEGKLAIALFETVEDYHRAGGIPGSGGCYVPRSGVVLVPMASLGLKRGSTGFQLDRTRKNHVLVHELVHQVTPRVYMRPGALGWFSEGVAEYVAVTPYSWGRFGTDTRGKTVMNFVTGSGLDGSGGRRLGRRLEVPRLRDFFLMSYGEFSGRNANLNYGFALLLNHYFFHMEGGGKARRITAFLRAMHAGKSGEAALEPLIANGGYEALEKDVAEEWAKLGVGILFEGE